ncbi:MAG: acyl-CoA dehydrogenase [Kiloniellales bacterium]|nr:acyl-CoA dehydrogenase [Kiloniellales bacterium]
MTEALDRWRAWLGRREETRDVLDLNRARAMQATLDVEEPPLKAGDPLPPLWHWLYFWSVAPASSIGPDGHAARGGFLPAIELPRRMWAGSRVRFPAPLPLGAEARRESEIIAVDFKEGRSGQLAFVTVRHRITAAGVLAVEEEHDIVYRAAAQPGETPRLGTPAPDDPPWRREVQPDPVLLFRYSALTFNGHRIHYDQPYVTGVESYPGLIVHGPLLATLMVELARRSAARPVASFQFRALRPIFDTAPFTVAGAPEGDEAAKVWVVDPEGFLAMDGQVGFVS